MKEILDILRQELILCNRLCELGEKQQLGLTESLDGRKISAEAQQIEALLMQLGSLEQRKNKLLEHFGEKTLKGLLLRQPFSQEKTLAGQLMTKLSSTIHKIQQISLNSRSLLQRNLQYIDFSVNVMTQASAGTTYTAPGSMPPETLRAKKMFDQSV